MSDITRIDLDQINPGTVRVRQWAEGWKEGDSPASDTTESGSVMFKLMAYEKQGFTCEMADQNTGRALRGKITRIDFLKVGPKFVVKKYPYGWTAKTRPIQECDKTEAEWNDAILWCESHGWNVRRWPEGARAFKGEPQPVRDAKAIMSMRRRAETEFARRENIGSNKIFYDFAYDW